jgi:membrane associated rhomboid family serine protease
MFGIYIVQLLTRPNQPASPVDAGWFTNTFRLYPDVLVRPWNLFQLVTYGFLHDLSDIKHILFNMLTLWIFGRRVEERYGRREYLFFFLAAVVVAGLTWVMGEFAANQRMNPLPAMLGASGGIAAVVILFAMNFPHQTVLFNFFIPMPMWVLALILVGIDVLGAIDRSGTIACTAHLGGAAFGFMYYKWGLRLERWLPAKKWSTSLKRRPKLRVLDPDSVDSDSTDSRVDDILRKIQEQGQDSLTRAERRILEEASKEYQRRRK